MPFFCLAFVEDLAEVVIELPRAHLLLELRPDQDLPQPAVRLHQHVLVVEQDVVDARDALVPQVRVVHVVAAPEQRQVEREMQVVVHVGARGDDPVHEAVVHQRDDRRRSQARRRQGPRQAHADGDVVLRVAVPQQLAGRAEPPAVVGVHAIDQLHDGGVGRNRLRQDAFAAEVSHLARTL